MLFIICSVTELCMQQTVQRNWEWIRVSSNLCSHKQSTWVERELRLNNSFGELGQGTYEVEMHS